MGSSQNLKSQIEGLEIEREKLLEAWSVIDKHTLLYKGIENEIQLKTKEISKLTQKAELIKAAPYTSEESFEEIVLTAIQVKHCRNVQYEANQYCAIADIYTMVNHYMEMTDSWLPGDKLQTPEGNLRYKSTVSRLLCKNLCFRKYVKRCKVTTGGAIIEESEENPVLKDTRAIYILTELGQDRLNYLKASRIKGYTQTKLELNESNKSEIELPLKVQVDNSAEIVTVTVPIEVDRNDLSDRQLKQAG